MINSLCRHRFEASRKKRFVADSRATCHMMPRAARGQKTVIQRKPYRKPHQHGFERQNLGTLAGGAQPSRKSARQFRC